MISLKVGVFDSGVGGITVLSELRRRFPEVEYVYFGDTAHVPYGPKSPAQIRQLAADCMKQLKKKRVDLVVVACNTASSWALPAMRKVMGTIPVVGVVEPGVEAALQAVREAKSVLPILVLATRATVESHAYALLLRQKLDEEPSGFSSSHTVIEKACSLLVPMIEEGWIDHPVLHETLKEYCGQYREKYSKGVALLGCTHYPWIHSAFEKALPGWVVVNSAKAIGDALAQNELAKVSLAKKLDGRALGKVEWIFTDPEAVPEFAKRLIAGEGKAV